MTGAGHLVFGLSTSAIAYSLMGLEWNTENVGAAAAVAAVSSLAADLDEPNSTLSKKLTIPLRVVLGKVGKIILAVVGAALLYDRLGTMATIAVLAAAIIWWMTNGMIQAHVRTMMLTAVGIMTIIGGFYVGHLYLVAFGAFVAIAPWTKHRSITHTLWALTFWSLMCVGLERHTGVGGLTLIGVVGYGSHLVADSFTKSRVKWLWPLVNKPFGIPLMTVGTPSGKLWEWVINAGAVVVSLMVYMGTYT